MTTKTPMTMAVVVAIVLSFLLVIGTAAVAGSYAIALHEISAQKQQQAQSLVQEEVASIRNAIPTCQALEAMDHAKDGATFPKYPGAAPGQGYGEKLATAIHQVVVSTKCTTLLADVAKHEPYDQIAKDLSK